MRIFESVLENEMHKILWDFEIQTDYSIQVRKRDFVLIYKKKNLLYCGFYCNSRSQKENERKLKLGQIPKPCQRAKKVVEHESKDDTNHSRGH